MSPFNPNMLWDALQRNLGGVDPKEAAMAGAGEKPVDLAAQAAQPPRAPAVGIPAPMGGVGVQAPASAPAAAPNTGWVNPMSTPLSPGMPGAGPPSPPMVSQTGAASAPVNYGPAPNPLATPGAPTPLNQAVAQSLVQSGMGTEAVRPRPAPPATRSVVSSGPGGLQAHTLPMGPDDVAKWMQQQADNQAIADGKLPSQDRYLNDLTKGTMSPLEQAMKLQPGSDVGDKLRADYASRSNQQQALGLENNKLGVERLKVGADLTGRQLATDATKDAGLDTMITASINAGDKPEVTQAKVDMYRAAKQYSTDDKRGLAGVGLSSPPINVGVGGPAGKSPAPATVQKTDPKELLKKASDVIENTASQGQMDAVLRAAFPGGGQDQQGRFVTSGKLDEDALIKAVADAKNVRGAGGVKDLMTKVMNSPGSGVGTPYDFRARLQKRLLGLHEDLTPTGRSRTSGNYGGVTVSPVSGGFHIGPQGGPPAAFEPHGIMPFGDIFPAMRDKTVSAKKAEAEALGAILSQGIGY